MKYIRSIWYEKKTHFSYDYRAQYYGASNFNVYVIYPRPLKTPSHISNLEFVLARVEDVAYDYKEGKFYDLKPIKRVENAYNEDVAKPNRKISIIKTIPNVETYEEAEEVLGKYISDDMLKNENIFRTKPPISPLYGILYTTSFLADPYTISSKYGYYGIYTLHKMDREEIEDFFSCGLYLTEIAKQLGIEENSVYNAVDNEVIYSISRNIKEGGGYNSEEELRIALREALQYWEGRRCFAKVGDKWMMIVSGDDETGGEEFGEPELSELVDCPFGSEKELLEALHDFIYSIPNTLNTTCEYFESPSESATVYNGYPGSYAQDVEGLSDDFIDNALGGNPDAYWNID
jgi:hypothetical protein